MLWGESLEYSQVFPACAHVLYMQVAFRIPGGKTLSFLAVMVLMKSCNISPNKHDQKNQKPKYKDPPIRKFVTFLMGDF